MKKNWVMVSSGSKYALLLGTDLFLLTEEYFGEVLTYNKNGCRSITVEVGQKESGELLLVIKEGTITNSGNLQAAFHTNVVELLSSLETTFLPVLPG